MLVGVKGDHLPGKNNLHVEAFDLQNQDLRQIPSEVGIFFPYLRILQWFNSNLWSLSATDLQQFPNLILLIVSKNKITTLDSDVFRFTPRLISINFENNLLFHVGENMLGNLRYLTKAYFRSNPCYNDFEVTANGIKQLNTKLPIACPPLPEESSTFSPTTVSLASSEAPEVCSAECLEVINLLEVRLVAVEKFIRELGENASVASK